MRKTAVSGAMSDSRAVHTCCCSYCCRSTVNGDLAWTAALSKIYCHKRDINLSRRKVCSVYHVLRKCTRGDRAVYQHRAGPGGIGHRRYLEGYDRGPNGIVRNKEERSWAPRRFSWYRAT